MTDWNRTDYSSYDEFMAAFAEAERRIQRLEVPKCDCPFLTGLQEAVIRGEHHMKSCRRWKSALAGN